MKIFHHVKRKFFTINKMLQHSAIVSQKSFGTILNSLTFNKIICNQQMINSSGNVVPNYIIPSPDPLGTNKVVGAGWRNLRGAICAYHWTLLRGPPRARVPSINLCVKKWNPRAPQRGGSSHSGEGQNRGFHLMKTEWRGYKKIPLVEFEDIYKTITGPYRGDLPARGFLVLICV